MNVRSVICVCVAALLTACGTNVKTSIPNFYGEKFASCMDNPATSWSEDGHSRTVGLRAAMVTRASNMKIRTSVDPRFRNPFASPDGFRSFSTLASADENTRLHLFAKVERVKEFMERAGMRQLIEYHEALSNPGVAQEVAISRHELRNTLNEAVRINHEDGFGLFAAVALQNFSTAEDSEFKKNAAHLAVKSTLIKEYLRAYFRNGDIVSVKFTVTDLVSKFPQLAKLTDDQKKSLNDWIQKLGSTEFGKIAGDGFVTRGGATIAFPGITALIDPTATKMIALTEIDINLVGADLMRVLVEAVFDSIDALPAVDKATGTGFGLPKLSSIKTSVSGTQLGEIETLGNSAHGASATVTGQVLRGANIVALNNEAVARIVESAVGTTARKVTEKVGWCAYYAGADQKSPMTIAPEISFQAQRSLREVTVRVQ